MIRPGGVFAVSVPAAFPEWVCWKLSDAYHAMEGGHIRIFSASTLHRNIEQFGFKRYRSHRAHALHVPYWWLKCLLWRADPQHPVVATYHRFLVWDLMKKPWFSRTLERILNPILGKSIVMYYVATAPQSRPEPERFQDEPRTLTKGSRRLAKMLDETAAYIASVQSLDGCIAWFVGWQRRPLGPHRGCNGFGHQRPILMRQKAPTTSWPSSSWPMAAGLSAYEQG